MVNGKQRVLIVDDEPRNQRIITEILGDTVDIRLASTGEEALTVISDYAPDLVLLDIMMPGIDGYEVCRRVRASEELNQTKIILVSGRAMVEERLKGYEAGADDYVTKPFAPEELLAKAKVYLRLALVEWQLTEVNGHLDKTIAGRTEALVRAQAQLVDSARMVALGEMAGGVAHEINTPLATITLIGDQLAEAIERQPLDRKGASEMVGALAVSAQRISTIIQGLRAFARDGSKDPFEVVPVRKILDDTLTLCGERLKRGGIGVRREETAGDLAVYCQVTRVSQALLSLIYNSCDAVLPLPEKWIMIAAAEIGGSVEVSVTDAGRGIPEAVRGKIFQPFFTTKDIGKGTGLGLSVARGIIESHGGSLKLDMGSPNTRFLIRLPRAQPAR